MKSFLVLVFIVNNIYLHAQNLLTSDPKNIEKYYNIEFEKIRLNGKSTLLGDYYNHDIIIKKISNTHYVKYNRNPANSTFDTTTYLYDRCGRLSLFAKSVSKASISSDYKYDSTDCSCPSEVLIKEINLTSDRRIFSYVKKYEYEKKLLKKERHFYLTEEVLFFERDFEYKYRNGLLSFKREKKIEYEEMNKHTRFIYKEHYRYDNKKLTKILAIDGCSRMQESFKYNDQGLIAELSKGYLGYHPMRIFYSKVDNRNIPTSMTIGEGDKTKHYTIVYESGVPPQKPAD